MEANERTIDVEEVGDVVCHLNIPQNGVDSGLGSDSEDGESSRDNTQKPSPSIARKLWNSFRFVVSPRRTDVACCAVHVFIPYRLRFEALSNCIQFHLSENSVLGNL